MEYRLQRFRCKYMEFIVIWLYSYNPYNHVNIRGQIQLMSQLHMLRIQGSIPAAPHNGWDWWLSPVTLPLGNKDFRMEIVTRFLITWQCLIWLAAALGPYSRPHRTVALHNAQCKKLPFQCSPGRQAESQSDCILQVACRFIKGEFSILCKKYTEENVWSTTMLN